MQHLICLCLIFNIFIRHESNGSKCNNFFLTVNSVTNCLQYNWDFTMDCDKPPEYLFIVTYIECREYLLDKINIRSRIEGNEISKVKFGKPPFPGYWNLAAVENPILRSVCYPYWIKAGGAASLTKCIKIEPSWMKEFGKLKVGNMMIPGTHASGSYVSPDTLFIGDHLLTQDYDIWGQLVLGIRYFDIRSGIYFNQVWINHSILKCTKLSEELKKIAKFLSLQSTEFVILHMRKINVPKELNDTHHRYILQLIKEILGPYILSRKNADNVFDLTLEDIWKSNKTLMVSYGYSSVVEENDWLWSNIEYQWGQKHNVHELYNYLNSVRRKRFLFPTHLCVLVAVVNPSLYDTLNNLNTLRNMTDVVNPLISVWLRKFKWSEYINIVATDFFLANDVVSISIEANKERLKNING